MTQADLFLELAKPDDDHFSRKVSVTEFVGKYAKLKFGNGAGWARVDGPLGKKYNIVRHKEGKGNAITHVELQGLKKQPKARPISSRVRNALKDEPCRVLGISEVQIDHKDGRYDDPGVGDAKTQKEDDFQPLSAPVNYAKRQHCKRCKESGNRFDATILGYPVGQVKGGQKYHGSCIGCYWYDPRAFNSALKFEENQ